MTLSNKPLSFSGLQSMLTACHNLLVVTHRSQTENYMFMMAKKEFYREQFTQKKPFS